MRRVFVFLLALVLMPSLAKASTYRCNLDDIIRSECCCPAAKPAGAPRNSHDSSAPSVRAACCCTVTHSMSVQSDRSSTPTSFEFHPQLVATLVALAPVRATTRARPVVDRPRAQGDPPASLFARRCQLLI
ncbi:MAG: hypothetical protein ABIY55_34645 [Kofleriaceae bacterium]